MRGQRGTQGRGRVSEERGWVMLGFLRRPRGGVRTPRGRPPPMHGRKGGGPAKVASRGEHQDGGVLVSPEKQEVRPQTARCGGEEGGGGGRGFKELGVLDLSHPGSGRQGGQVLTRQIFPGTTTYQALCPGPWGYSREPKRHKNQSLPSGSFRSAPRGDTCAQVQVCVCRETVGRATVHTHSACVREAPRAADAAGAWKGWP